MFPSKKALALALSLLSAGLCPDRAGASGKSGDIISQLPSADRALLERLPVQSHGRVLPLHSFARETALLLNGRYGCLDTDALSCLFALLTSHSPEDLPVLYVGDARVRKAVGLHADRQRFTLREAEGSSLREEAGPLLERRSSGARSSSELEGRILDAYHQLLVLEEVSSQEYFFRALDFSFTGGSHGAHPELTRLWAAARGLLDRLGAGDTAGAGGFLRDLDARVRAQEMPALFRDELGSLETEVFYNKARLFTWAALCFALAGALLLLRPRAGRLHVPFVALGMGTLVAGFGLRIRISGFAPVTNMYGTMIWVALGTALFNSALLWRYRLRRMGGLIFLFVALLLLFTESVPLFLNPGFDPVVAVLRSNFWLTLHVLTVTVSYAAFTVAMLLGNALLVSTVFRPESRVAAELLRPAYRMVQLGVLLLSAGIILGGVWADYSWGRFWGWDPKETWALVADLGFVTLLHARYVGWVREYGFLAGCTVAYLLVVMAWYGVNFVLATGLHSYGFSSGGADAIRLYLVAQAVFLGGALALRRFTAI